MTGEFENQNLPAWCKNCNKQGYYFPKDMYQPNHVIHKKCGYEVISAHCPDCSMGFAIPNPPGEKPKTWTCDGCGKVYDLPGSVYEHPLNLYTENELPEEVLGQIGAGFNKSSVLVVGFILVITILLIFFFTR